jgi:hypothetical protein
VKLFASRLLAPSLLALTASVVLSGPASAGDVTMHVYGARAGDPQFRVMIQSSDQFANRASPRDIAIDPSGEATFVFRNVRPGRYAVAIPRGHGDWGWLTMRVEGRLDDPWLDIPFGGATFDLHMPDEGVSQASVRVERPSGQKLPENSNR